MNQITALLFPDTAPLPQDTALLGVLCDALHHYALPSDSPEPSQSDSYLPVAMSEEEQARFRHLVRDITGNEREFYLSQLASLSTGRTDRQENAAWSLVSSIRAGSSPAADANAQETVWQAMLLLRLAERLREEEAEIADSLSNISDLEAELLAEIKGEEELDADEEAEFQTMISPTGLSGSALAPGRLLKAWGRLFLQDAKADGTTILTTAQEEAANLLLDLAEAQTQQPPLTLCRLLLPVRAESFASVREAVASQRPELAGLLQEATATEQLPEELLTRLQQGEEKIKRAVLPWVEDSPQVRPLTLYGLQGLSPRRLFTALCEPGTTPTMAESGTTLLAVLGPATNQR